MNRKVPMIKKYLSVTSRADSLLSDLFMHLKSKGDKKTMSLIISEAIELYAKQQMAGKTFRQLGSTDEEIL